MLNEAPMPGRKAVLKVLNLETGGLHCNNVYQQMVDSCNAVNELFLHGLAPATDVPFIVQLSSDWCAVVHHSQLNAEWKKLYYFVMGIVIRCIKASFKQ